MTPQIALFIPCLVDQVMPDIGVSMVRLLRALGYQVTYPANQTCCGQPAYNSGQRGESLSVACHCLDAFAGADIIVSPSGSCTSMLREHYHELFVDHPRLDEAKALGTRVFELAEFLVAEKLLDQLTGHCQGTVGVHTSCHAYRELGLKTEAITLLKSIQGVNWVIPPGEPVCCGFGGTFSAKFQAIARSMGRSRLAIYTDQGADTLVVTDPGCIMHFRQVAKADGLDLEIIHLAQFLDRALLEETTP